MQGYNVEDCTTVWLRQHYWHFGSWMILCCGAAKCKWDVFVASLAIGISHTQGERAPKCLQTLSNTLPQNKITHGWSTGLKGLMRLLGQLFLNIGLPWPGCTWNKDTELFILFYITAVPSQHTSISSFPFLLMCIFHFYKHSTLFKPPEYKNKLQFLHWRRSQFWGTKIFL